MTDDKQTHDLDAAQERITGFWSRVASEYEAHPGNVVALGTPQYGAWVEALRSALPPPPSDVLDVGAGTGFLSMIAAGLGHRVTAVDLAEPMLDVARAEAHRRALELRFHVGDAVAPPFPPQSFDAVTSRHLLWTLREPERAFANWHALLRPGGRVIAMDALWFSDDDPEPPSDDQPAPPEDEEPGIFEQHYTAETKAVLPVIHAREWAPLIAMFEHSAFVDVTATPIDRLAQEKSSQRPVHVLIAHKR